MAKSRRRRTTVDRWPVSYLAWRVSTVHKARERATYLGLSLNEYIRRLMHQEKFDGFTPGGNVLGLHDADDPPTPIHLRVNGDDYRAARVRAKEARLSLNAYTEQLARWESSLCVLDLSPEFSA